MRACNLDVQRPGLGVSVGNPHVVVALANDEELDGVDLGYIPILEPVPDDRAYVEFVVPADPSRWTVSGTFGCGCKSAARAIPRAAEPVPRLPPRRSVTGRAPVPRTNGRCRSGEERSACECSARRTVSSSC